MKKNFSCIALITIVVALLSSCSGTINTVKYSVPEIKEQKKAYIISAENSQYIKFKFGAITPLGYVILPDDPAQKHEIIGNTDLVIKNEVEKYGVKAEIVKKGDELGEFDSPIAQIYPQTLAQNFILCPQQ